MKNHSNFNPTTGLAKASQPRQGVLLDWLIVLLNLVIVPLFGSRLLELWEVSFSETDQAEEALAIIAKIATLALIGRYAGLYFKCLPLRQRLAQDGLEKQRARKKLLNILWFIGGVTTVFCVVLAVTSWLEAFDLSLNVTASICLGIIVVTGIAEIIFYSSIMSSSSDQSELETTPAPWRLTKLTEYGANAGLFIYLLFFQSFYLMAVATFFDKASHTESNLILSYAVAVSLSAFLFLLFYLPPRIVFLLEDMKFHNTWLSILAVFISSIASVILF